MTRRVTLQENAPGPRLRIPRWLALVAGLLGSGLGIATNLYSAEFRAAFEAPGRELGSALLPVALAAIVASGSTALVYWWLVRRKQPLRITKGEIEIRADALELVNNEQDFVVGRVLRYLEAKRDSD